MKKSVVIILIFTILMTAGSYLSAEQYHFLYEWGDVRLPMEFQLHIPRGVDVDDQGFVYVSDTYNGRVVKYDAAGNVMWLQNECEGQLLYPMLLAVGPDGGVYVPDLHGHRIVVLKASDGTCVGSFGSYGSGPEEFNGPIAVAFDKNGNLYVSDRGNRRILKFRWDALAQKWTDVKVIGPFIEGYGELKPTWGIAIDDNWLYVSDEPFSSSRVVKLDLDGNFISSWGGPGIENGRFVLTGGIDVDDQHRVYVADIENQRIQRFFPDGSFDKIIGGRGTGGGQFQFPSDVAIDRKHGWLYVADNDNSRIQKLDLEGNYITQWGADAVGDTHLRYPTKLAIDNKNRMIYVLDSGNHKVLKLTLSLRKIAEWGGFGSDPEKFRFPFGVDIDEEGNVYVADNVKREIQVFSSKGEFLRRWTTEGIEPSNFLYGLHDVYISGDKVYVVDASSDRVYLFDLNGNLVASYVTDFYSTGLAIEGNAYLISTFNKNRVVIRDLNWNLIDEFGKGLLFHPYDVTLDRDGNIFVTDTFLHRFVKFAPDGTVKNSVGSGVITEPGAEPGQFDMPYGIEVDNDGFVYVADTNNHRLQKFTPDVYHITDVSPVVCAGAGFNGGISFINWGDQYVAPIDVSIFVPDDFAIRDNPDRRLPILYAGERSNLYWAITAPTTEGSYIVTIQATYPYGTSESIAQVDVVSEVSFADVPCNHWAFGWIEKFYQERITEGCSLDPLKYCPDAPLTRGQMAVFIIKLLYGSNPICNNNIPCEDTLPYFSDVPSGHIFYRYIQKMKETGITVGCGDGIYCPDRPITRAEMAVFIVKARRALRYQKSIPSFKDVPNSHWAYDYIEALNRLGITSGCGKGNYCPDDFVTRAQMAVFLSKAFLN